MNLEDVEPFESIGFSWPDPTSPTAYYNGAPLPFPHATFWSYTREAREKALAGTSALGGVPDTLRSWEALIPCGENGAYFFMAVHHDEYFKPRFEKVWAMLYVGKAAMQTLIMADRQDRHFVIGEVSDDPRGAFDPLENRLCVLPDNNLGWWIERTMSDWQLEHYEDPLDWLRKLIRWVGSARLCEIDRHEIRRLEGVIKRGAYHGTPCAPPGLEGDMILDSQSST